MKCERIYLDEKKEIYLDTYLLGDSEEFYAGKKRKLILICPGGGYQFTSDREAEPIALAFNAMGHHAVVLEYHCDLQAVMPQPLRDLAQAIVYVKQHADEWRVDPEQVYVAGFSAGGHLAASLGVFWKDTELIPGYEDCRELLKPAGMILGYPVIDLKSTQTRLDIGIPDGTPLEEIQFGQKHPAIALKDLYVVEGEKRYVNFEVAMNAYMFGGYATEEQLRQWSLEYHVTPDTPPAFIWHGGEDGLIYPRNSTRMASAMVEQGIPVELHIFGRGGHGLGLANEVTGQNPWERVPDCEPWIGLCRTWLEGRREF